MKNKDIFDEYVQYGLKNWAAQQTAPGKDRANVLLSASAQSPMSLTQEKSLAWMESRKPRKRSSRPIMHAPIETFNYSWIWVLHLSVTPMKNLG